MTPAERQAVLRATARLLLEAGGVATREVGKSIRTTLNHNGNQLFSTETKGVFN
jgi:hypothetical protein